MASDTGAIKTQLTKFYISQGTHSAPTSPIDYLQVLGVQGFDGPGGQADEIETTDFESTAKEYLMGLPDNGTIQISGNFRPINTGQLELKDARDTQQDRDMKVVWSDGTIWTFHGFVLSYSVSAKPNSKADFTATIRISGAVTQS